MTERVKPIRLTDKDTGKVYVLEYNRRAVDLATRNGFAPEDLSRYPILFYDFFFYAFVMHHSSQMPKEKTDKLIDECWGGVNGVPEAIISRLIDLWNQVFTGDTVDPNPHIEVEL